MSFSEQFFPKSDFPELEHESVNEIKKLLAYPNLP